MTDFFNDPSLTLNGLFKPETVRRLGERLLPTFSEMVQPSVTLPLIRPESPCLPLDLHMSPKRNPPEDDSVCNTDAAQGLQPNLQPHSAGLPGSTTPNKNLQQNSEEDQEGEALFSLSPQQLNERAQEFLRNSRFGSKRKLSIPIRMPENMEMEDVTDEKMGDVSDREVLLGYYQEMLVQKQTKPQCTQSRASISDSNTVVELVAEETRKPETYSPTSSPSENSSAPGSPISKSSSTPPSTTVGGGSPKSSSPQPASQGGPEQGSYPCSHCDKNFAYMGNLKRHIKMHHGEYRPYKCSLCVKRFWGNDSLEQHVKRVHSRFRPYECAHCDKKYSVCYDLQKHVRSVHGKDIDWNMEVPSVGSSGSGPSPAGLGIHKVTGIKTQALNQLNHKCKFCGRGFATFNGLGVHLKMHFRCRVCLKGFNTESSLRIHLQKAHDITGDQEYVL
ncbi:uncharacterized protein LOC111128579 isoform X2 [Crassostrea virginica]